MGWCGGTDIFDPVVKIVLAAEMPEETKFNIIRALTESLGDQDWDCESESAYYEHSLVRRVFVDLYPDWFADEDANEGWEE